VKIDQFVEGFTIALACSRDEIQRVLPRARRSRRRVGANRSVELRQRWRPRSCLSNRGNAADVADVGCTRREPRPGPGRAVGSALEKGCSMSLPFAVFLFLHVMGAIIA